MDPSRLNINPNAKARIRERFFKRCPVQQTKAAECDSVGATTKEIVVIEKQPPVQIPECRSDVLFAEKDEGFPMITSVFSLATPVSDNEVGNSNSFNIPASVATPLTMTGSPPACQSNGVTLPFVVQCTNGVINVGSPPHTPPISTTSQVDIVPPPSPPPLTPKLASPQPATSITTHTCTSSVVNSTNEPQSNLVDRVYQTADSSCGSCDTITSGDHPKEYLDSNASPTTATEKSPPEPLDQESTKALKEIPFVTKHDDKIRRLKELLRQQENELEKLRFKKKHEESSSPKPSTRNNLRIEILKNRSPPEFKPPKSFEREAIQTRSTKTSESTKSSTVAKQQPTENRELLESSTAPKTSPLKRKGTEIADKTETSPKRKTTGSELQQNPEAHKDKYRLVNVTVVKGHTRTLAVPVDTGGQPATLTKDSNAKERTKVIKQSDETQEQSIKSYALNKQKAAVSGHNQVNVKPEDRGGASARLATPLCNTTTTIPPNKTTPYANTTTRQSANTAVKLTTNHVANSTTESIVVTTSLPTQTQDSSSKRTDLNTNKTFKLLHNTCPVAPTDTCSANKTVQLPASQQEAAAKNNNNLLSPLGNQGIFLTSNGGIVTIPATKTIPSQTAYASGNIPARLSLGNSLSNVPGLTATFPANPTNGLNTSPNKNFVQRQLHTIAPKPVVLATQTPKAQLNEKVFIYSLPKSIGASGSPNFENRQIIVCNVIQPSMPANQAKVLLTPVQGDKSNVLVYVTNQPTNPQTGFNDKGVLNTEQSPVAAAAPQKDLPKDSVVESSQTEFIPNPEDVDFTQLVGLEHVVQSLNST